MRYKLTLHEVSKRKIAIKKQQTEQQALLNEIREAVSHMRYMGLSSMRLGASAGCVWTRLRRCGMIYVQAKDRIW